MFEKFIATGRLAGINTLVWKGDRIVHEQSIGPKNTVTGEMVTSDTIFRIASMTKPITSVLAMILYEEGKIKMDDPLTKWFFQFGK